MNQAIAQALELAGLPYACCPMCDGSDWMFTGSTKGGFDSATCRRCGRRYQGMTAAQEYAHWADKARDAARNGDLRKVRQAHTQMRLLWDAYPDLDRSAYRLICVAPGASGFDDDEPPF